MIVRPSSKSRRSFTYIQNNKGPRTEPCGTPKLVFIQSELPFFHFTREGGGEGEIARERERGLKRDS